MAAPVVLALTWQLGVLEGVELSVLGWEQLVPQHMLPESRPGLRHSLLTTSLQIMLVNDLTELKLDTKTYRYFPSGLLLTYRQP